MITSILIANRGEIASRIIKTCKRLGIRSIAVYAEPDKHLPFVNEADIAFALEGNQASESYLVQDKIIAIAKLAKADAIHPGFGFLSENGDFARRCQTEGFIFIGPNPDAIDAMGLKSTAKTIMEQHGVPTIKGYQGKNQELDFLVDQANSIGFPILVKAVAGGGGKGMRIAKNKEEVKQAIEAAQREALNSFGNAAIILERYFPSARHIEFQIFGDQQGNIIHLLERECSIQRRYQKVIEESPSPSLTDALRKQMGAAAVLAGKAIQYDNAGTVEFILTDRQEFFFLEVNTRLQVEHPVTEMITGLDLVEWQILVAEGQPLPLQQEDIKGNGYALECRLYAEDALNNFFPSTGDVLLWETKNLEGLRYETGIESGSEVGIYFDPMLAKIIAHAPNRAAAFRKMDYALKHLICLGLITNQAFLIDLIENNLVQQGQYDTNFINKHFDLEAFKNKQLEGQHLAAIAALVYTWQKRQNNRQLIPNLVAGWRNNLTQKQEEFYLLGEEKISFQYSYQSNHFLISSNQQTFKVEKLNCQDQTLSLVINGEHHHLHICQTENQFFVHHPNYGQLQTTLCPRFPEQEQEKTKGSYQAPMPSEVLDINVKVGDTVSQGQNLITLLSMKMENTIVANENGLVEEILVEKGASIKKGTLLLKIKAS